MLRRVHAVVGLVLLVGCTTATSDDDTAEESSAIVNGEPSDASQDAVVRIVVAAAKDEVCTGTLVAPNAVLTARHCFAKRDVASPRPACRATNDDGLVAETTPDFRYTGDVDVLTTRVTVGAHFDERAPDALGLELFDDGAETMCGHDIAVLVLDRAIRDVAPREVRTDAPRIGEALTAVGWGFTGQSDTNGQLVLPTVRMQRRGVEVLAGENQVHRYTRANGAEILAGAMDGEFIVGESVCNGDSGGPLFDAEGRVVGVTSRRVSMHSRRCVDSPIVMSHAGAERHRAVLDRALERARELLESAPAP